MISMKLGVSPQTNRGLTLLEFLVVVAVLVVLFAMFIPDHHVRQKAEQINCLNNLKQTGLAYRIWAEDNSVQCVPNSSLVTLLQQTGLATNRLAIP